METKGISLKSPSLSGTSKETASKTETKTMSLLSTTIITTKTYSTLGVTVLNTSKVSSKSEADCPKKPIQFWNGKKFKKYVGVRKVPFKDWSQACKNIYKSVTLNIAGYIREYKEHTEILSKKD